VHYDNERYVMRRDTVKRSIVETSIDVRLGARVTGAMVSGKSLEAESARRSGSEEVSLS